MSYSVSGTKLFDGQKEFQFHGVNTTGFETKDGVAHCLWDGLSFKEYVAKVKDEGFNGVRIPVGSETMRNIEVNPDYTGVNWYPANAYMKGMRSFDLFKEYVKELESQNMRYIFDSHHIENGKLAPLWYTPNYSEAQWLADISTLASTFRGNKGFVGIDVRNEPDAGGGCTWGSGNPLTDFKMAAEKAHAVIARVNPDILTVVEWIRTSFSDQINFPLNIPADKLLMSDHVYGASVWGPYTKDFDAPNYPMNMPAIWMAMFGEYARTHAVFHGEFGGRYVDKDKQWHDTWVPFLLSLTPNPHTAWWCLMDDSWDTGGLYQAGSKIKNQDKLNMLKPLRTGLATYTEQNMPKPTPTPTPTPAPIDPFNPTPTPSPVQGIAPGAIVELISGSPKLVVSAVPATTGNCDVTYYNPISGAIVKATVPQAVLRLSTSFALDLDLERDQARARILEKKFSAVSPGARINIKPTTVVDE